jgi:hypothetical protein
VCRIFKSAIVIGVIVLNLFGLLVVITVVVFIGGSILKQASFLGVELFVEHSELLLFLREKVKFVCHL